MRPEVFLYFKENSRALQVRIILLDSVFLQRWVNKSQAVENVPYCMATLGGEIQLANFLFHLCATKHSVACISLCSIRLQICLQSSKCCDEYFNTSFRELCWRREGNR